MLPPLLSPLPPFYLSIPRQDPKISSYYGISKVGDGGGALRFALEGRKYDWSQFDRDEQSKARLVGWTCLAAGEDGRRTFAFCGRRGASVVKVGRGWSTLFASRGQPAFFVVVGSACMASEKQHRVVSRTDHHTFLVCVGVRCYRLSAGWTVRSGACSVSSGSAYAVFRARLA